MRHWIASLALALATGVAAPVPAKALEIAVSPARFELPIEGGRSKTQALEIVNTSNREVEVSVDLANFDLDENNQVRILPPTEQSLDQWIAINPSTVTIPAQGRRTMRFAIRPQVQPAPGEHRAVIFLNEGNAGHENIGGISFRFRIGVVVYGQVGEPDRAATLHRVAPDQGGIALEIENTGNAHARFAGVYAVWDASSYPGDAEAERLLRQSEETRKFSDPVSAPGALDAGVVTETPILPGARRIVVQPLPDNARAGQRKVFLLGKLGDADLARSFGL